MGKSATRSTQSVSASGVCWALQPRRGIAKNFLLEMNLSRKKMASPSASGRQALKPRSPSRVLPGRGVLWSSAKILACASWRLSHIWAGDPGHTSAHKLYLE
ncbi:conserved hypothetical protein [Coccidioides posadasii str. Silveira]|uniref:Uncharacterized protein n=1 Tax=Coccidioides posadasii (strain RMSCC 757 / Silveira) TaxID=443226 RepID=E9DF40_COCPS|nr:conserved hypothetical protein [Coccidioides posadasii str. Silveira]